MAITLYRPSPMLRIEQWSKNVSTAWTAGDVVGNEDGNAARGFITMVDSTRAILGIIQNTVASSDADYATAGATRGVLIDEGGIFRCDVNSDNAADGNDEGGYIDMDDTNDATEVDVTATTEDHVLVQRFVSATVILGRITAWASDSVTTRAS